MLENLDRDRAFLKNGGVFDDDFIDSYIELKMTEVERFEMTPQPVEFDMYYSLWNSRRRHCPRNAKGASDGAPFVLRARHCDKR